MNSMTCVQLDIPHWNIPFSSPWNRPQRWPQNLPWNCPEIAPPSSPGTALKRNRANECSGCCLASSFQNGSESLTTRPDMTNQLTNSLISQSFPLANQFRTIGSTFRPRWSTTHRFEFQRVFSLLSFLFPSSFVRLHCPTEWRKAAIITSGCLLRAI